MGTRRGVRAVTQAHNIPQEIQESLLELDFKKMKKAELVDFAISMKVDSLGTKQNIIDRLLEVK